MSHKMNSIRGNEIARSRARSSIFAHKRIEYSVIFYGRLVDVQKRGLGRRSAVVCGVEIRKRVRGDLFGGGGVCLPRQLRHLLRTPICSGLCAPIHYNVVYMGHTVSGWVCVGGRVCVCVCSCVSVCVCVA